MNRRLGWVLALATVLVACGAKPPLNVVIVTFDTTRADRIGCFGRDGAHTPNLDRLAAEGVVFEQCRSAAPITMPSHSTIMTGTNPNVHGVRDNGLFELPADAMTLAEILHARGYATAAAIGSFVLHSQFGISQGFEFYDDQVTRSYEDFWGRRLDPKNGLFFDERPAQHVNDAIRPWMKEHADGPFFVWLHYWDPHHPHIPPPPYDQILATDLYQAEIANADEAFGGLMQELRELGVAARTLVVFTSDHGEGLGEHDEATHSFLNYDATLHVPLVVKIPRGPVGVRVGQMVGTVDIAPTVLDALGLPIPEMMQGRSLLPLLHGEATGEALPRPYYAEAISPRTSHGLGELRTWYDDWSKYIHGPRSELFDLRSDPRELDNLIGERRQTAEELRDRLARYLAESSTEESSNAIRVADRETLERLEALGYVTEGGGVPGTVVDELRQDGDPPQDHVSEINRRSAVTSHLARGEYLAAKEICLDQLERNPRNLYYLALSASAFLGLGQSERAAEQLDAMPQVLSGQAEVFFRVAGVLASQGEPERSLALVDRGLGGRPDAKGFALRAEILRLMGDHDGFMDSLRQAIEVDESYVPARTALGAAYAERGELDRAATEFSAAITHDPLNQRAQFNYGRLLADLGRLDEARPYLERAIELDEDYWLGYLALIAVDVDLGQRERARETYERLFDRCSNEDVLFQADLLITTGE